jgi:exopolysaccharide production protein ExoQ
MSMKSTGFSEKKGLSCLANPAIFMGLIAVLTPIFTLYLPLSLAVILPVGAVLLLVCRFATGFPKFDLDPLPLFAVGGMLSVVALSALWSYAPGYSLDRLPRTSLVIFAGVIFITAVKGLDDRTTRISSRFFLAGMVVALICILIEKLSGGTLSRYSINGDSLSYFLNQFNRPLSILSILIWPAAVLLARRHWALAIAAVGIYAALLPFFLSSAAIAAVAVGAVIFAAVYILPKVAPTIVGLTLAAAVLAAPTIDHYLPPPKKLFESLNLPRSTYHRLLVWEFTTQRIEERPILGWGFNTSRAIPGGTENLDISEKALPLHPHNAALQWRLELGILGALFGAGMFLVSTEMARRYAAGRVARAGAVAAIGATFVIAMISFGAWQTWWVSSVFLIAGFTILVCRRRSPG